MTVLDRRDSSRGETATPAVLFELMWQELVDLLGSGTAATLVKRAATRAQPRASGLSAFTVAREQFEYRCVLPPVWLESSGMDELRELCVELHLLLVQLTGATVVNRLRSVPELAAAGLFAPQENPA